MSIQRAQITEIFDQYEPAELLAVHIFSDRDNFIIKKQVQLLLNSNLVLQNYYQAFQSKPNFRNLKLLAECLGQIYVFSPTNKIGTTKMLVYSSTKEGYSNVRDCKYPALILQLLLTDIENLGTYIVTKCSPNSILHPTVVVILPDGSRVAVGFMFDGVVLVSKEKYSTRLVPLMISGKYAPLPGNPWSLLDELLVLNYVLKKSKEDESLKHKFITLARKILSRHPEMHDNGHFVAIQKLINYPNFDDEES